MVDELYDRTYQAGREQLHAGIDRGLARLRDGIAATFNAIHAIEFAAPWAPKPASRGKTDRTGLA